MIDTDAAVEFVVAVIWERREDLSMRQVREMVELARDSIAADPTKFVDRFIDNLSAIEKSLA